MTVNHAFIFWHHISINFNIPVYEKLHSIHYVTTHYIPNSDSSVT